MESLLRRRAQEHATFKLSVSCQSVFPLLSLLIILFFNAPSSLTRHPTRPWRRITTNGGYKHGLYTGTTAILFDLQDSLTTTFVSFPLKAPSKPTDSTPCLRSFRTAATRIIRARTLTTCSSTKLSTLIPPVVARMEVHTTHSSDQLAAIQQTWPQHQTSTMGTITKASTVPR